MIRVLLEDIKSSSTCVVVSKYVQSLGLRNYVSVSQHNALECLIHILHKGFPDIYQSLFLNKVIESAIC